MVGHRAGPGRRHQAAATAYGARTKDLPGRG